MSEHVESPLSKTVFFDQLAEMVDAKIKRSSLSLSKREWMAGMAMIGKPIGGSTAFVIAQAAVEQADALLKALEEKAK